VRPTISHASVASHRRLVGVLPEDLYKLRAKSDKATEWKHLEGRVSRARMALIER